MAEALFEERLVRNYPHLFPLVEVHSAGTSAIEGNRVTQGAVQAMDIWGIDVSHHQASPLTSRKVMEADLVLVLSREHLLSVERIAGSLSGKVYTLKYLASLKNRVLDSLGTRGPRNERELMRRLKNLKAFLQELGVDQLKDNAMESTASDIIDPIGGTLETYLTVVEEIDSAVEDLMLILFGEPEVE